MSKMADNENISINNTATEYLLLNEPQAKSTPIINNKVSLEDLFQLMEVQNNELNDKLNQFDEQFNDIKKEIKKQSCNFNKRINEIETRLDELELENKKGVDKLEVNKDDKVSRGENCNNINIHNFPNKQTSTKELVESLSLIHI